VADHREKAVGKSGNSAASLTGKVLAFREKQGGQSRFDSGRFESVGDGGCRPLAPA